jgi:hypothetical protein
LGPNAAKHPHASISEIRIRSQADRIADRKTLKLGDDRVDVLDIGAQEAFNPFARVETGSPWPI